MLKSNKKRTHIKFKNQIIFHYFCNVVGIKCNGTSLYSFIEPRIKDSNKWRSILNEGRPITAPSLKRMIDSLSIQRAKLSKRDKYIAKAELTELNQCLLWHALQDEMNQDDIKKINDSLPLEIQRIIKITLRGSNTLSRHQSSPGNVKIMKLEKIGSYDALAAMLLILRDKDYSNENFEDVHVHLSAYRLLMSFFQHPSFYAFRHEIWRRVKSNVVQHDPDILQRMGLSCWTMPIRLFDQMIDEERVIIDSAIAANMIEDFKDAPLFLNLLYRDTDRKKIIQGLSSIAANKPTQMMPLDNITANLFKTRRRGKNTLRPPSETFEELSLPY